MQAFLEACRSKLLCGCSAILPRGQTVSDLPAGRIVAMGAHTRVHAYPFDAAIDLSCTCVGYSIQVRISPLGAD